MVLPPKCFEVKKGIAPLDDQHPDYIMVDMYFDEVRKIMFAVPNPDGLGAFRLDKKDIAHYIDGSA